MKFYPTLFCVTIKLRYLSNHSTTGVSCCTLHTLHFGYESVQYDFAYVYAFTLRRFFSVIYLKHSAFLVVVNKAWCNFQDNTFIFFMILLFRLVRKEDKRLLFNPHSDFKPNRRGGNAHSGTRNRIVCVINKGDLTTTARRARKLPRSGSSSRAVA